MMRVNDQGSVEVWILRYPRKRLETYECEDLEKRWVLPWMRLGDLQIDRKLRRTLLYTT